MPKGKRKGRTDRSRNEGSLNSSDEDSYINDNASIVSINNSECRSTDDEAVEEQEEKLTELIDGLTQKSSQGRTNCFTSLTKAFIKKYMPGFIKERYFTMCDSIERSLKKGVGGEQAAASELATILCVQLGADDTSEEICRNLKPILLTTICDTTVSSAVRAKCCRALGNINFLAGGDIGEIHRLMQNLETIYAGSYLKGDGSVPNITPEMSALHAAAISAWSLLFTLISPGNISTMINDSKTLPSLKKLSELLESTHLEVRMAAGEALALVYELGREESDDFEEDFALDVSETLKQLATDSHKYRAKKERKQQRATFRDILQFIENDTIPEVQVKFGKETLVLDTWTRRKQYDILCDILGPSINHHLTENDLLREILEITEPPPPSAIPPHAQQQMERMRKRQINAANFKARTISRAKNRDKRSDF